MRDSLATSKLHTSIAATTRDQDGVAEATCDSWAHILRCAAPAACKAPQSTVKDSCEDFQAASNCTVTCVFSRSDPLYTDTDAAATLAAADQPDSPPPADEAHSANSSPWDASRPRDRRLCEPPAFERYHLTVHATALRVWAEQTSATCAAAAVAAAWNVLCMPRDAGGARGAPSVFASLSSALQLDASGGHVSAPPDGAHRLRSHPLLDLKPAAASRQTAEQVAKLPSDGPRAHPVRIARKRRAARVGRAGALSRVVDVGTSVQLPRPKPAADAKAPWPLFEADVMQVYIDEEQAHVRLPVAVAACLALLAACPWRCWHGMRDSATICHHASGGYGMNLTSRASPCVQMETAQRALGRALGGRELGGHAYDPTLVRRLSHHISAHAAALHSKPRAAGVTALLRRLAAGGGAGGCAPDGAVHSAVHNSSERTQSDDEDLEGSYAAGSSRNSSTANQGRGDAAGARSPFEVSGPHTPAAASERAAAARPCAADDGASDAALAAVLAAALAVPLRRAALCKAALTLAQHAVRALPQARVAVVRCQVPTPGVNLHALLHARTGAQRGTIAWQACWPTCTAARVLQRNLAKLCHATRPTTAPIGTARVRGAIHTFARRHSVRMHARTFLSAHSDALHRVRASDEPAAVDAQWRALVATLRSPDAALLYHMENHYSLVYGAREWRGAGNVADGVPGKACFRQVLVGKPGQQPSRWIAFEDVRACVLGWTGYAMLCIRRDSSCAGEAC